MTAVLSPSSFFLTFFFLPCILRGRRLSCTAFSNTARAFERGPRIRIILFKIIFNKTASRPVRFSWKINEYDGSKFLFKCTKFRKKKTLHIIYLHIVVMFHRLTWLPTYLFSNRKYGQILSLFLDWFLRSKLAAGFIFIPHMFSKLLIIFVIFLLVLFCILEDKEK